MATITPVPTDRTVADLVEQLGDIPLERIRLTPPPGQATEDDLLRYLTRKDRLFELIDGTLVEKTMGVYESVLATVLIQVLRNWLDEHKLGFVFGADGPLRVEPQQVRLPDVSFVSWDHVPNREIPAEPILDRSPDLAVEVLSKGNSKREMQRKLREYFAAGTRLVWYVDPNRRTIRVFRAPDESELVSEDGEVDGGEVLPGFRLSVRELFDRAGPRAAN